jgi:Ni/Fe-hydrogenase subunit HybB-like protein
LPRFAIPTRWANITAPGLGQTLADFYTGNAFYGYWILFAEIVLCGVVPAIILISRPLRKNPHWRVTAFILGVIGVSLNRWVMVLQVMAVPIMPFDNWALYIPQLAGSGHHHPAGGLRHHPDHDFLPLPADLPQEAS